MGHTIGSRLVDHYRRRIGEPRSAVEVYGYWVVVLGLVLGILGIGTFLWGSVYAWGTSPFWLFRETGVVLAAIGLPVLLLGITFRLPLQPAATAISGVGLLVAFTATVWFVVLYPTAWFVARPPLAPVFGYTAGVVLCGAAITLVPLVVAPVAPDQDTAAIAQPYYSLLETPRGWTWHLYSSDGVVLGESAMDFDSPAAARADIDQFSVSAPVAGIEVLTRMDQ